MRAKEQKMIVDAGAGKPFACSLRINRRSRSIRLRISADGKVVLSMPSRFHLRKAEAFLREKADWIVANLKEMEKRPVNRFALPGIDQEYRRLRSEALAIISAKVEKMNASYGFPYSGITIRNQRSRWGSCSSKGRLSYSYRVAFLPERHQEYVIAHELCHLKEFNHSARFWSLVSRTIPDHAIIRREMRSGNQSS